MYFSQRRHFSFYTKLTTYVLHPSPLLQARQVVSGRPERDPLFEGIKLIDLMAAGSQKLKIQARSITMLDIKQVLTVNVAMLHMISYTV